MTEACMYKSLNMYFSKNYSLLKTNNLQILHKIKHASLNLWILLFVIIMAYVSSYQAKFL